MDRRLRERELARREQPDSLERLSRTLGAGVELTDGLHPLAEEVDTKGGRAADRKQVDEPTAHGELARFHDLGDAVVRGVDQLFAQAGDIQHLAHAQHEALGGDEFARRQPMQQRRRRGEHEAPRKLRQPVERLQTLRGDVLMRGKRVVGQALPVGEEQQRQGRVVGIEPDLVFQLPGGVNAGGNDEDWAGCLCRRRSDGQAAGTAAQTEPPDLRALRGRQYRRKR